MKFSNLSEKDLWYWNSTEIKFKIYTKGSKIKQWK